MSKKFVPVVCKRKVHRLFQEDLKKIYYMNKVARPCIPKFEEKDLCNESPMRKGSMCLESDNDTCF